MTQATLARPYARAAFAVASEQSALAAWSDALAFAARIAADPQVAALLGDPRLTAEAAVTLLLPDAAARDFDGFLHLLFENHRLALLPEIAGLYDVLRFEAERVVKATITSAEALPAAEIETLKAALRRRFGREVEVDTAIDAGLIGGVLIDAGDVVIDGSLRGRLARLHDALVH